MSATPESVTMVKNAVHNPADARHFMRIVDAGNRWTATLGDTTLADSANALKVKEVAYDVYDPVIYFPRADVDMALLVQTGKTTHCPLKGDTAYFDADCSGVRTEAVAWSYVDVIDGAEPLKDYVAFDTRLVRLAEIVD